MKKIRNKKIYYTAIIYIGVLFSSITAHAAVTYTQLEPQAFAGFTTSTDNSLASFLGSVFNFGIAAAVVLALVMIIWGGITYMTTDSWQGKNEGRDRIENALYGLGLALISYLILYTINPCTVDFMGNKGCSTKNTFLNPVTINTTTLTTNISATNLQASCSNCLAGGTIGLPCKDQNSCQLNSALANKLDSVLKADKAWVTEGYPPTVTHISTCHNNGTCADVNLVNKSTDPTTVKKLYDDMVAAGLSPAYELPTGGDCSPYTKINVKCITASTSTGAASFHVNM